MTHDMMVNAEGLTNAQLQLLDRVATLFAVHGQRLYDDARREPVTALAHALQCAQLAEWADAEPALIAAALLHDVGHFTATEGAQTDDAHELRALPLLAGAFGPSVLEPIRLHVMAKRYLVSTDRRYAQMLSAASVHSLALQGGPMDAAERAAFEALPFATNAMLLRRWDDAAKEPQRHTPPLAYYLDMLAELMRTPQSEVLPL